MDLSVYFNPACTNCTTVEGIFEELGLDAEYIRYLEKAPSKQDIEDVLKALGTDDPRVIIRTKEPIYEALGLDNANRDTLIEAMTSHPILIQRPIVIRNGKAVIARPAEVVRDFLKEQGVTA